MNNLKNYIYYNNNKYSFEDIQNYCSKEILEYHNQNSSTAFVSDDILLLISLIINFKDKNNNLLFVFSQNYSENLKKDIINNGFGIVEVIGQKTNYLTKQTNNTNQSDISIFTSGTTGTPKLIRHSWKSLNTFTSIKTKRSNNWLLTYYPTSYAWYQMIMMFCEVENQNLLIPNLIEIANVFEGINIEDVTAVSSTPSFWKFHLLKNSNLFSKLKLNQITLGGEYVDQNILDSLSEIYPLCNITHIYASAEAGATIVVKDKKEGFPFSWLSSKKTIIKIVDSTLFLKSKNSSIDNQNIWYNTKDKVKIENNRVVIIGRENSRVINVGGNKINLSYVQSIILKSKDIIFCRVYSKRSPILNNIIVADVVISENKNFDELKKELVELCKINGLEDWMIPRRWYNKKEIVLSRNFKIV